GGILDKAVVGGANRVSSVRYDVKEKKALFDKARQNAVANAKEKAQLYATSGGFKLGKLSSLTEHRVYDDDGQRSEGAYLRSASASDRAPVPTAPG
ncbi:SIMPL domain-containing protein, partial [Acinetobacter baumannii]